MKKFIHILKGKWGVFVLTCLLCGTATLIFLKSKPAKGALHNDLEPKLSGMPVTVQHVSPAAYPARICALGEVKPLWQSTIKARIDGPVVYLNPRLQPGTRVKKGDVLVKLETTAYQAQVSEDENRVAQATVELLKEEREAQEAQRNWKRSGIRGTPACTLVLRKPQLNSARTNLTAAQNALALSKTRLSYTRICAPFDGVILDRHVNPGETILTGDPVFTLYGVKTAEVSIQVSAGQLALLGISRFDDDFSDGDISGQGNTGNDAAEHKPIAARLVSTARDITWQARVVRGGKHLNPRSRLQTLFLQVEQPMAQTPPLLPGTFVRAEITGRNVPGLLCLPDTALTQQGEVWFVDKENRLQSIHARPLFYGNGVVYIHPPEESGQTLRIAVRPNASFACGTLVRPAQKERG